MYWGDHAYGSSMGVAIRVLEICAVRRKVRSNISYLQKKVNDLIPSFKKSQLALKGSTVQVFLIARGAAGQLTKSLPRPI
jgi:hypothetical protein